MAPILQLVPPADAGTIGERMKTARGHRTQEAAAKACGVSVRTYRNWEHDDHSPSVEGVKRLSTLTGWPVTWIIGIDDEGGGGDGPGGDTGVTDGYLRLVSSTYEDAESMSGMAS